MRETKAVGYLQNELNGLSVKIFGEHVLHDIIFDVPKLLNDPNEALIMRVQRIVIAFKHLEVDVVQLVLQMLIFQFVEVFDLILQEIDSAGRLEVVADLGGGQ